MTPALKRKPPPIYNKAVCRIYWSPHYNIWHWKTVVHGLGIEVLHPPPPWPSKTDQEWYHFIEGNDTNQNTGVPIDLLGMHYAIWAIFKMATLENDENNKRSIYYCYWRILCIIIVLSRFREWYKSELMCSQWFYLGYTILYGPFSKWPPLKNDENNKRLIYNYYNYYWRFFCIIIVPSIDSGNDTNQNRCVVNYLFRMHYVIWTIFKMATFKKMTNTKDIMTTK